MEVRIEEWTIYRAIHDDHVLRWAAVYTMPSGSPIILLQGETRDEVEQLAQERGYEVVDGT